MHVVQSGKGGSITTFILVGREDERLNKLCFLVFQLKRAKSFYKVVFLAVVVNCLALGRMVITRLARIGGTQNDWHPLQSSVQ